MTASSTTSEMPLKRIAEYKDDSDTIEIAYITRSYFTRHGAGYLVNECSKNNINPMIEDKTNVPNPYQDSIRYGKFDLKSFEDHVRRDINKGKAILNNNLHNVTYSVFATHLNYVPLEPSTFNDLFNKYYGSADPYAENIHCQML